MAWPPAWYLLLLIPTLVAVPLVLRRAVDAPGRRFAGRMLAGLLLVEAGLILLFYGKVYCWPLVAVGVAVTGSLASARHPVRAALITALPAFGAGVAFQWIPGEAAYLFYFAFALPLALFFAFAPALAERVRRAPDARSFVAAGGVLLFAALTPASSFGWTFLEHYEVFQLPVLLVTLGSLYWLTGRSGSRALGDATIGERLGAPWRTPLFVGGPLLLAGVLVGAYPLSHAPLPFAWEVVAWGAMGFAFFVGLVLVHPVTRRWARWLLPVAGFASAFAVLLGARSGASAFFAFIGGGPALETSYFYLAGLGSVLVAVAALVGVVGWIEMGGRRRLLLEPERFVQQGAFSSAGLPLDHHHEQVQGMPDVDGLAAYRDRLLARGDPLGVLEVLTPLPDPLVGLPEPVAGWLSAQSEAPFVHLAVREGKEVFLVPMMDPEVEA